MATLSPEPRLRRFGALVVVLFVVIYIVPLDVRPLFIPDETRYAEIAWEMPANHDWTVLRQAGIRYYEKPPLGYWVNAVSQLAFGHNYFAVRFPSALAAGLCALALFLFLRRERGDSGRAVLAAAIFLTFLEVFGVGTFATLDSLFSLFVALSLFACYLAETQTARARLVWHILAGIACAAAFLTKGFTALVIPALTLSVWLVWEGRFRHLLTCWAAPLLTALAAVLPVALLLHHANPGFWRHFLWVEHVQRFLAPGVDQHRLPFWFFLPVLAAGALPWTFFLPAAIPEMAAKARRADDRLTRFCLAWFAAQFLFFSACGGKLPTYILPGFPPLAALLAEALLDSRSATWLRRSALAGAAVIPAAVAGFLVWLPHSRYEGLRAMLADPMIVFPTAALVSASAFLYLAAERFPDAQRRRTAIGWAALSFLPAFSASFFFLPVDVENCNSPSRALLKGVPLTPPGAALLAERNIVPGVAWHFRRADVTLFGGSGEFQYGLGMPEAAGRHLPDPHAAAAWVERTAEAGRAVAVCATAGDFAALDKNVVKACRVNQRRVGGFVWALYEPGENMAEKK